MISLKIFVYYMKYARVVVRLNLR